MHHATTPLQEVHHPVLEQAGVQLVIKREDLNHPFISGNKWWKLKWNIREALHQKKETVLTFGGAFSNHIYATAAAAKESGLKSIGIIRGEKILPLNTTLAFAQEQGMDLQFISRSDYRKKTGEDFIDELHASFGDFYLIPEGGTNLLAVKGCAEFAQEELSSISFDHLFLPVGTGGTMAGMICGFEGKRTITGVSVLKTGEFLRDEIDRLVEDFCGRRYANWSLLTDYHHGGYAKTSAPLLEFIRVMNEQYRLPLDAVYTGKLLWAIVHEAAHGSFARGSTVLALHTGGLQANLSR